MACQGIMVVARKARNRRIFPEEAELCEGIGRQRAAQHLQGRAKYRDNGGVFVESQKRDLLPDLAVIPRVYGIGDPLDRIGEHLRVIFQRGGDHPEEGKYRDQHQAK